MNEYQNIKTINIPMLTIINWGGKQVPSDSFCIYIPYVGDFLHTHCAESRLSFYTPTECLI